LKVWDTAGFEKFRALTQQQYRKADAIILVYDIGDAHSFLHLSKWLNGIERHAKENVTCILVGNKSDRTDRKVSVDLGKAFAEEHSMQFMETSAKDASNISELFAQLAMAHQSKSRMIEEAISLTQTTNTSQNGCSC